MNKRIYSGVKVFAKVRCMSDGHHWFTVRLLYTSGGYVHRDYQPGIGFAGLGNAFMWEAPKYLIDETDRQIGQMCRDNKFKVHECDRDGNERTEDLRYHDPDMFKWYGEQFK